MLPTLYKGSGHSAYAWLRRAKEGQLPPGNSNVRKALIAVEVELIKHFGQLNGPQQVQLSLLRPVLIFWILHPGFTGTDSISQDFKWAHARIESGLKVLCELADRKHDRPPTLEELLQYKEENNGDQPQ